MSRDEIKQLRAATREAHEAIAGGRELLRDLATERRAVEQLLASIEGRVKRLIEDQVQAELNRQTKAAGDELWKAVDKAIKTATEKVYARFDHITAILLGTYRPDGESIEALARKHIAARGPVEDIGA